MDLISQISLLIGGELTDDKVVDVQKNLHILMRDLMGLSNDEHIHLMRLMKRAIDELLQEQSNE